MARTISHPFRIGPGGGIATVTQGSDQANGELIGVLVRTVVGERPLSPAFGITDPTFGAVEATEIAAGIAGYGPDVTLSALNVTQTDHGTTVVHVDYS